MYNDKPTRTGYVFDSRPSTLGREEMENSPTRQSHIAKAVNRLASLVNSLAAKAEALSEKLTPIIRAEPPVSCGSQEAMQSSGVPLADNLFDIGEKLERLLAAQDSLYNRIEL